jgi:predicted porin
MKKELLLASALVSTMGFASVANAVTATMSGMHATGLQGNDSDEAASGTIAQDSTSDFSVSLSETTDGGIGIATSFMLANESGATHTAGLTLTFTDGSKLDVFNAGNAAKTHDISVPGGAGSAGVTVTSTNNTQTGLDFFGEATPVGIEWHSAADFMADGLKVSASVSFDDGAAADGSVELESGWGVGATYVTSAGDTAVTIGAGLADSEAKDSGNDVDGSNGFHVGFSAVTGDLTVAAAYANGDKIIPTGEKAIYDNTVTKVGVKYVAGDVTLSAGFTAAEGDDGTLTTAGGSDDSQDITELGVSYAVASGVTANLGFKDIDAQDEGAADTTGGSSWYVGATMSF